MTTTEVLKINIDGERSMAVVPRVKVVITGATAEVAGYIHVVVTRIGSDTVNHYEILVESWGVNVKKDELQQKINSVAAKAKEKAEEYIDALKAVLELGADVTFKDGTAHKSWLPEWLRKHIE